MDVSHDFLGGLVPPEILPETEVLCYHARLLAV